MARDKPKEYTKKVLHFSRVFSSHLQESVRIIKPETKPCIIYKEETRYEKSFANE